MGDAAWQRGRGKEGGASQRASFGACAVAGVGGGLALRGTGLEEGGAGADTPLWPLLQDLPGRVRRHVWGTQGKGWRRTHPRGSGQPRALRADSTPPRAAPGLRRQRGGPRLRPLPREPGASQSEGSSPAASAGSNWIPGAAALRGLSQSAARTGRGRTRAEIQTGGVGAERPARRAGGAGGCRVSAARGSAALPFPRDRTGRGAPGRTGAHAGPSGAARRRPESWRGVSARLEPPGPPRACQRASDAALAQGGRRGPVLPPRLRRRAERRLYGRGVLWTVQDGGAPCSSSALLCASDLSSRTHPPSRSHSCQGPPHPAPAALCPWGPGRVRGLPC